MQKNIYLPQIELTMENVEIVKWLVKEGDFVQPEQNILEVETQKALNEIPAGEKGYLRKCCVNLGESVRANALLCILTDTADESYEEPRTISNSKQKQFQQK